MNLCFLTVHFKVHLMFVCVRRRSRPVVESLNVSFEGGVDEDSVYCSDHLNFFL